MRPQLHILTFLLLVLITSESFGQSAPSLKGAKRSFSTGNYKKACREYRQLIDDGFSREKHLMLAGRACYACRELDQSLGFFQQILKTTKKPKDELSYHLGKTLHGLGKYDLAMDQYKAFLKEINSKDDQWDEVTLLLQQAWQGSLIARRERLALVQNAGEPINSEYSEVRPIPSPTVENKFYFAKASPESVGGQRDEKGRPDDDGFFRYDIYSAELNNGKWQDNHPIDPFLNSSQHDIIQDFSDDGQRMYFMKYLYQEIPKIVVDTFSEGLNPLREQGELKGPWGQTQANFDIWENDIVVFAAALPDSYGKKDLYLSIQQNGNWIPPRNLGPHINSSEDEDYPFFSADGTHIYFSSKGNRSIGGYDILWTALDIKRNNWLPAQNIGLGINSHFDDTGFRISRDGQLGVLSSDRPGTMGKEDIYLAYFKSPVLEQLRVPIYEQLLTYMKPKVVEKKITKSTVQSDLEKVENLEWNVPEFYEVEDGFMETAINQKKAQRLVKLLITFPRSILVLNAHSSRDKSEAQALYFSAVYAGEIKTYLMRQGISDDRIFIKSFGNKQPIIKALGPGVSAFEMKYNNRITSRLVSHPDEPLWNLKYEDPEVEDALRVEVFRNTITGLNYRLEVESTSRMLNDPELIAQSNLIIQQQGGQSLNYVLVGFTKYSEAKEVMMIWKERGYIECKMVPYVGERKIDENDLNMMSEVYPDLENYILEN